MKGDKAKSAGVAKYIILSAAVVLGIALLAAGSLLEGKYAAANAALTEEYGISDAEKYARNTEQKIKELCEKVQGAEDITVVVTLKGSYSAVYERQGVKEVLVGYRMPEIQGIGIVCRGGENPEVRSRIISIVSASTGVGFNKIYVCEAQN